MLHALIVIAGFSGFPPADNRSATTGADAAPSVAGF
jgi:hypothetical protein